MIHQFTALILSCLMLVVSATSQVGLRFCLCEQKIFFGECPCDIVSPADEVATHSCCESCNDVVTTSEVPCDDCDLTISIDFDKCVPHCIANFRVSSEVSDLPFQSYESCEIAFPKSSDSILLEISRGPPVGVFSILTPLYLEHSVFLI